MHSETFGKPVLPLQAKYGQGSLGAVGGSTRAAWPQPGTPPAPQVSALGPATGLLSLVLDQLDYGVIVCDKDGHLILSNDAARREISLGNPLALDTSGQLQLKGVGPDICSRWRAALFAAVHSHKRQLLTFVSGGPGFSAAVLPLGGSDLGCALVLLSRRHLATDIVVTHFGQAHDLTEAESKVLSHLANGMKLKDLACERKVKMSTLRAQVASLREKTGVSRMGDLVLMLAGLPPMTSALRCSALNFNTGTARGQRGLLATGGEVLVPNSGRTSGAFAAATDVSCAL